MPIGFCTAMCTAKKIRLFFAAFQNGFDHSASVSSVTKLARPTKWNRRAVGRIGRQTHRRDQRVDREQRVDRDRRPEESAIRAESRARGIDATTCEIGSAIVPSSVLADRQRRRL
jgi:hypothetical protein